MEDIIPRELCYIVYRKLDIDTRRILGIYTKLKVPQKLIDALERIPRIQQYNENFIVNLPVPVKEFKTIRLIKCFDTFNVMIDFRVLIESKTHLRFYLIWSYIDD